MLYFDHSATTPIHPEVIEKMNYLNKTFFANPSSTYAAGRKTKSLIEKARNNIASAINANAQQIIFTSGGTEANNQIIWNNILKRKKHIIVSAIEHPAILKALQKLNKAGITFSLIPVNKYGKIKIASISNLIQDDTCLLSVMYANNEVGTIQPIKEIVEIAKDYKIPFHSDAVQALGKIKVDVKNLNIDSMSISAHKFYGPKGVGALYIKDKKSINPLIIGGNQELGIRGGTENLVSIVGMGLAAKLAASNQKNTKKQLQELETYLVKNIKTKISGAIINGDPLNNLPGLISVSFPGKNSEILMAKLDRAGIAVSNGSACNTGTIKPSIVLKAMGINDNTNLSTLRISLGNSNTKMDIDKLLSELIKYNE